MQRMYFSQEKTWIFWNSEFVRMPFKMCECEDVGLSPRHHLNIYIAQDSLIKRFLSFNKSHVCFHIFSHSYFQFSFFLILLYLLETLIAFMLEFFFTLSSMTLDSLIFTIICLSPSCITIKQKKRLSIFHVSNFPFNSI